MVSVTDIVGVSIWGVFTAIACVCVVLLWQRTEVPRPVMGEAHDNSMRQQLEVEMESIPRNMSDVTSSDPPEIDDAASVSSVDDDDANSGNSENSENSGNSGGCEEEAKTEDNESSVDTNAYEEDNEEEDGTAPADDSE